MYDWIVGECTYNAQTKKYELPGNSELVTDPDLKIFDFTKQHLSLSWSGKEIPEDYRDKTIDEFSTYCNNLVQEHSVYQLLGYNCQSYKGELYFDF